MKIVSENRFYGKTYFYTIASRPRGEVKKLTYENRVKLENYLERDELLYDHFLRKLDKRIRWEVKSLKGADLATSEVSATGSGSNVAR